MASTREIRRRIRSVANIAKITRAMETVAASRMRKAQNQVMASRPYSEGLRAMIGDLASGVSQDQALREFPLLAERPNIRARAVVLVTPDKGLVGPLNSNIFRRVGRFLREDAAGHDVEFITIGKKGRDFMRRTRREIAAEAINLGSNPSPASISGAVKVAIDDFTTGKVDSVHLVFPRFVNTLSQVPDVVQLLPVPRPESTGKYRDFIFEPDQQTVLNELLPRYVEGVVYQALLDTIASEFSARMVAMRSASDNAKELGRDLSLTYNKVRQASITAEVAEISAGANASR
ncbi:MAG TPA: ATP synthase F1 subunit gamma [Thermomicrobiales bacterium]|jgi:F-type H+-transporting ATPase subunit gamma|nr:ATP synthase F1 subunit gamma [Thermomicrobiales bacterium]